MSQETSGWLDSCHPDVRQVAHELCALVRTLVPDAVEESDSSARLIGFTYLPGTYKGLFVAVAPQRAHVNLMFSRGVELTELDDDGLLEGTGKKARHIKLREPGEVDRPGVRRLIVAAADRTPRS